MEHRVEPVAEAIAFVYASVDSEGNVLYARRSVRTADSRSGSSNSRVFASQPGTSMRCRWLVRTIHAISSHHGTRGLSMKPVETKNVAGTRSAFRIGNATS